MTMTKEEASGLAILIVIVVVIIGEVVDWFKIQIIHFARFMFWIDFSFLTIGILIGIGFLIAGFRADSHYFSDSSQFVYFIVAGIFGIAFFFSFLTISHFYEKGYSDSALLEEARLENEMAGYEAVINLLTGQTEAEITNQVVFEIINSTCQQTPSQIGFDCEQMKGYYKIYVQVKGAKDTADEIASIWKETKN